MEVSTHMLLGAVIVCQGWIHLCSIGVSPGMYSGGFPPKTDDGAVRTLPQQLGEGSSTSKLRMKGLTMMSNSLAFICTDSPYLHRCVHRHRPLAWCTKSISSRAAGVLILRHCGAYMGR